MDKEVWFKFLFSGNLEMIFINAVSISTLYLYIMEEKWKYPWNWTKYPISLEVKWKVSYILISKMANILYS